MTIPTQNPSCGSQIGSAILSTGWVAATYAITAAVFTSINPITGAIAGASYMVGGHLFSMLTGTCTENTTAKTAASVVGMLAGLATSGYIAASLGYPAITFTAALLLTLGTMAAAVVTGLAVGVVATAFLYMTGVNFPQEAQRLFSPGTQPAPVQLRV